MRKFTTLSLLVMSAISALANIGDLPTDPSTTMITDPVPGATPEVLVKTGEGFIRLSEGLDILPSDGSLTKMLRSGDKMFLGNIFSWAAAPGWIEGTVDGNQVTFQFPQLINEYDEDTGIITRHRFYAVVCNMVIRGDQADMVPTTDQKFSFTILEDGTLIPEKTAGGNDYFLGNWEFTDNQWDWNLDGDFYTSLSPQSEKASAAPAAVEFKPMVLTYPHILYGGKYADEVYVGFDGDDCYIKGIALGISDLPDATIKGTRSGRVVTFDSNQFLGDSWLFGFTQYFIGGETEFVEDSTYGYWPVFTPMSDFEFVYDETEGTLTSDMSFIIVPYVQEDAENLYYENIYNEVSLFPVNENATVTRLSEPEVLSYESLSDINLHVVDFIGSMVSADNQLLDMSKLYFQFLVDGKPLEFTPKMDPNIKAPTSLIPFGMNDYICFVAQEKLIQMVAIPMDINFDTLQLRYVYDPESSKPVYSNAVTVAGSDAVQEITSGRGVSIGYTDMQGRMINSPEKGIYIRTDRMDDGSLRKTKVIINTK